MATIKRRPWTSEEERFVVDNAYRLSDDEIAKKLKRTLDSVKTKRIRLGVLKPKKRKGIYEVVRGYQVLATGTLEECAKQLNVSIGTVRNYAKPSFWKRYKNIDRCIIAIRIDD